MITSLTPEQQAAIDPYREEWRAKALRTDPINEAEAERAIKRLYRAASLREPEVRFYPSPMACLKARGAYQKTWFIGGWEAFWLAFYKFAEKIGVDYGDNTEHLNAYVEYAETCGVMYAYEDVVFCSDRPSRLKFDNERRLHCELGQAMEFRDGYGLCSWHGTRVPRSWILEAPPSAAEALAVENAEQRRAACEIVGWVSILKQLNAKTIDKHPSPFIGELVEVDTPKIGKREKFLRVLCGTGREFAIPVDIACRTALEAQSRIRNIPEAILEVSDVRT